MPLAPWSNVRVIIHGSEVGIRTIDAVFQTSQALDRSPIWSHVTGPCSHSIQMPSNPNWPRKSTMLLFVGCPPTMVTGFPSASLRLIWRFAMYQYLASGLFGSKGNWSRHAAGSSRSPPG